MSVVAQEAIVVILTIVNSCIWRVSKQNLMHTSMQNGLVVLSTPFVKYSSGMGLLAQIYFHLYFSMITITKKQVQYLMFGAFSFMSILFNLFIFISYKNNNLDLMSLAEYALVLIAFVAFCVRLVYLQSEKKSKHEAKKDE